MSCNTMRDLEYERQREEERKRKRKKAEEDERKRLQEKEEEKRQQEKERREKAITTVKEQARRTGWMIRDVGHRGDKWILSKPNSADRMEVEVFEDGRVRLNTPGTISMINHPSADTFANTVAAILKGRWKTIKRHLAGGHSHAHTHEHHHH
jgi:ATPase subunit of ABC transporter with duplicated ATPase domains